MLKIPTKKISVKKFAEITDSCKFFIYKFYDTAIVLENCKKLCKKIAEIWYKLM